jgi:phenylacetate-CoA ligase
MLTVKEIFSEAEKSRFLKVPYINKIWKLVDDPKLFEMSPDALKKLRMDLSRDALRFFREHSTYYAQLFENLEIDPATAELADMAKLTVPADMLRGDGLKSLLVEDCEEGGKWFTSSGTTSKTPIRIYRSPLDLAIMIKANTALFEYVYGDVLEEGKGIALFMAAEELKDMLNFVAFVDMTLEAKGIELLYGMDLVDGDESIWKRLVPNKEKLVRFLKSKEEPKLFFTAPAGVHLMSQRFDKMNPIQKLLYKIASGAPPVKLGRGGLVVTGGGTKGVSDLPPHGEIVDGARRQFKALNKAGEAVDTPFMDVMGMTETLTALIDKHGVMGKVPHPLQNVFLMDPTTYQLTEEKRGILGVLTPYTTSWLEAFYPGDIMSIKDSPRYYGQEFIYERRLTVEEGWELQRACGGTMEELMDGGFKA